jgi:hypothetical protein
VRGLRWSGGLWLCLTCVALELWLKGLCLWVCLALDALGVLLAFRSVSWGLQFVHRNSLATKVLLPCTCRKTSWVVCCYFLAIFRVVDTAAEDAARCRRALVSLLGRLLAPN